MKKIKLTCAHAIVKHLISQKILIDGKKDQLFAGVFGIFGHGNVACLLEVAIKDNKVLSIDTPKDTEVNAGHTCLKGRYAFGFYNHKDRLTSPLIKKNGKFEKATWNEAYNFIKDKLDQQKKLWT